MFVESIEVGSPDQRRPPDPDKQSLWLNAASHGSAAKADADFIGLVQHRALLHFAH
ncbi:MAG: hypothetical protein KF811_09215 [Dokdonella sp.]|nr:hypothetical protein [Dokdonella sp.]MCB1570340.1 hypothetical protein [Xanthomonadales bacterium]MCB1573154.1 hypothetical protein [Xanthomonadales bacterium]MCB1578257.1 hypothetical protein [Xanthomonadales bacterium]